MTIGEKEYMNRRAWLAVLLVLVVIADASAGILVPVWKGLAGTTHEEWSFGTSANPAIADVISNPYGTASASITAGVYGVGWLDNLDLGTKRGFWDVGGSDGRIVLSIDNNPVPLNYKEIWVQVVYYRSITGAPLVTISGAQMVSSQTSLIEEDPVIGGGFGWYADATIWRMEPSPSSEQIVLTGNAMGSLMDQIVVDTYSTTTLAQATISGSTAVDGVTMNGLPGNPVTTGAGFYSVEVPHGWSGTVIPTKVDYVFTPYQRTYENVTTDKLGEDYAACYVYDLNCSGSVGYDDLAILCSHWLESGSGILGDFDHSQTVNFLDYAIFVSKW
jgi:hypothetical protein